jgi:hypothetical protein
MPSVSACMFYVSRTKRIFEDSEFIFSYSRFVELCIAISTIGEGGRCTTHVNAERLVRKLAGELHRGAPDNKQLVNQILKRLYYCATRTTEVLAN